MKKPQLFMFPFAGGNCYSYRFMYHYLKDYDIVPIELPGRGMRSGEPLNADYEFVVQDAYNQVIDKLCSDVFLIYGHSMGAILAFSIVKLMEANGIKPQYLIVTGSPGPEIKTNENIYLLNDKDFILEVKKLGGIPEEVLNSPEMLEYITPILKTDFEICAKNNLTRKTVINTPIYCIMGNTENNVEHISNWSRYTHSDFLSQVFEGHHFFIYNAADKISSIFRSCIKSSYSGKVNQ